MSMSFHKEIVGTDNGSGGRGECLNLQPLPILIKLKAASIEQKTILNDWRIMPGIILQTSLLSAPGRRFGQILRSHHRPKVPA